MLSLWVTRGLSFAGLLLVIIVQFLALTSNRSDVVVDGQIYFVDADCYSRMTRVQSILDGGPWSIREHQFENWPTGTRPHTTAPLDLAILGLRNGLLLLGVPEASALDLAGAWISPIMGVFLVVGLWVWMGWMALPYRWIPLILISISPVIVQAMKFGRPDHQSLLMLLIAAGVAAEITMWLRPHRMAAMAWGCAWCAALWVSLFEPMILFCGLFFIRIVCLRWKWVRHEWVYGWGTLGVTGAAVFVLDGWRVSGAWDPVIAEYFPRWATMLGELMPVPLMSMNWFTWGGIGMLVLPILLGWQIFCRRNQLGVLCATLLVLTFCLSVWQIRWASYFLLLVAMSVPFAMSGMNFRPIWVYLVFIISLWPTASAWDRALYPGPMTIERINERRSENIQLRSIATAMRSEKLEAFLAPWWLSPALSYWSGQPGVSGSSHQSLPGIVDTARFFLSNQPDVVKHLLDQRMVTWVVVDDSERVQSTAAQLLKQNSHNDTMANMLANRSESGILIAKKYGLVWVWETNFFVLYRHNQPEQQQPSTPAADIFQQP